MMFFLTLSALSRAHGLGRQHSCISDDRSVRSCREERAIAMYNTGGVNKLKFVQHTLGQSARL